MKIVKWLPLEPVDKESRHFDKAKIMVIDNGDQVLYSFNKPIIRKTANGELVKLFDGFAFITGNHIKAFCGLGISEFMRMPVKWAKKEG